MPLKTVEAQEDPVRRYARLQVPRYTSYPTAAEFSPDVTAANHRDWLRRLDPRQAVSLYIHVPYCRDICFYCGCHSKKAVRDDVVEDYRTTLEREIDLVGQAIGRPVLAARLHWGGGTPSALGGEGLTSVVEALRRHFVFAPDFEHAIELDPRFVTEALVDALVQLGVNRVSLGVQDVNPAVQAAIGRLQPVGVVEAAVARLRAAGIDDINFDLIYGLPLQTVESLQKTCEIVAAMAPDRIAYYGYAHIPERKANQRQIDSSTLPGAEERFAQAAAIAAAFTASGYVRVGIDHFARPDDRLARAVAAGRLHRNFQGYTDDEQTVLVGFGSSAISQFVDGYTQNVPDVPRYVKMIAEGRLATVRGCRVDAEARRRARIIESLLCRFEADLDALAPELDLRQERDLLVPFVVEGLATIDGNVVAITDRGRVVARVIAAVFDVFYQQRVGRFSVAV